MRGVYVLLLISLLGYAGRVGGQESVTITQCYEWARANYPQIHQMGLIDQTERYSLSNVGKAWLPQLSVSGKASYQSDVTKLPLDGDKISSLLPGFEIPSLSKDQYQVVAQVDQTIWDGGKSAADKRIAEAEAAEQRQATDVDLYALEGRVDDLYFGILLLDERVAQTKLTLGLLRSNLDKVRSLQRNGAAMQSDADAVEAELLTVEQQLAQVEASRESYRRMLELFIGEELAGRALVRPDVAEPASFEAARPELALFDAQAEKLAAQRRLVKSATRPRFGLFAQGYYGYPGMDYFESMMANDWSWNALVGFRMSWNFGAFYTKKNSLGKLRTAQRQLDVQRDVFLFNTRLQTVEESGDIARLRRALADDDRIVQLRRAVREAAESKLRNGVIDTNDLLRKITEEATAATARSAREIELVKTIYELKHTINR